MAQAGTVEQLQLFDCGVDMARLRARTNELVAAGQLAHNTRIAYEADWRDFTGWCRAAGRVALPAAEETVCLYLAHAAERLKHGSLMRRVAAIRWVHRESGAAVPTGAETRKLLAGVARTKGAAPAPKRALTPADLRRIMRHIDSSTREGARDRALILLGFATGIRRANLVALDVEDLSFTREGLVVRVRREKNDQAGRGRVLGVFHGSRPETCPVAAVRAWLRWRGREDGPLFVRLDIGAGERERLRPQAVQVILQRAIRAVGMDPAEYGAHSLRAGMATAMSAAGAADHVIMERCGHKTPAMVRRYVREANLFAHNPLAKAL